MYSQPSFTVFSIQGCSTHSHKILYTWITSTLLTVLNAMYMQLHILLYKENYDCDKKWIRKGLKDFWSIISLKYLYYILFCFIKILSYKYTMYFEHSFVHLFLPTPFCDHYFPNLRFAYASFHEYTHDFTYKI